MFKANKLNSSSKVDISGTMFACQAAMVDPLLPISYDTSSGNITVKVQFALNNLISIDEIGGTATLDFFFRLYW